MRLGDYRLTNGVSSLRPTAINTLARVAHLASSGSSIPIGRIELVLHKKNYGVVLYELELHLNRLTHLLGAGQAGTV